MVITTLGLSVLPVEATNVSPCCSGNVGESGTEPWLVVAVVVVVASIVGAGVRVSNSSAPSVVVVALLVLVFVFAV